MFLRLAFIYSLLFFLMGQRGEQGGEIESAQPVPVAVAWLHAQDGILPASIKGIESLFSLDLKAGFGMNRHVLFLTISGDLPDGNPRMKWICSRYLEYKPLVLLKNGRSFHISKDGEIPPSA